MGRHRCVVGRVSFGSVHDVNDDAGDRRRMVHQPESAEERKNSRQTRTGIDKSWVLFGRHLKWRMITVV